MAVIDSRELAEAKAKYLAALKRMELAESNFNRFESLWKKDTIAEKQFLEVKTAFSEAQIELQSAQHKLYAMGFSDEHLKQFPLHPNTSLTRYEIVAPFDGTVINKHITLGEMLKEDADAFVVADLGSVWVNLSVNQKDLPNVKEGQSVTISGVRAFPRLAEKLLMWSRWLEKKLALRLLEWFSPIPKEYGVRDCSFRSR